MFCILFILLIGPRTWIQKLSNQQHEKYSSIAFRIIPFLAFFLVFGFNKDFWNTNKAMFSNDGSFGFQQSAHFRIAFPGGTSWNDLWWLGEPEGLYPIGFYYVILWLFNHPISILIAIFVITIIRYIKSNKP